MNGFKAGFLSSNRDLLIIAGLALLVLTIYFKATGHSFINLDDNLYVYNNPALQNGLNPQSVAWAFTTFWSANWHPLTWLSHSLDIEVFGLNAGMHHAVNVLFHLINSILAFIVFRRMTGREWESLIVAALFAVHPAHVESVAWIAERKDVLSTMFWLLAMLAYVNWIRRSRRGEQEKKRRGEKGDIEAFEERIGASDKSSWSLAPLLSFSYVLLIVLIALGLMAKPMLVTLPFVLLLCDFWPLHRLSRYRDLVGLVAEKLPLFALSAASCVITFLAQHSVGAVESLDYLPISMRLSNAVVSYAKYIVIMFYPADLAVYYPYDRTFQPLVLATSAILLIAITALCTWQLRRRPFLLMGWLWYLGTLVPVIGVLQVGSQSLADRYTYVPYFGLFVMLAWGTTSLVRSNKFGVRAVRVAFVVAILILTGLSIRQVSYWRDNETLYRHALAVTTGNFVIAHNLCHHLMLSDRLDEAEPYCRQAIEIRPTYNEPYNTLGIIEFKRGNFVEAERDFQDSIDNSPGYVYAYTNLAKAQSRQGKAAEAEESLRRAVELNGGAADPIFVSALSDIAAAFTAQRNYDKTADELKRLLYIDPANADARAWLALTLYSLKRYDEAQDEAGRALTIKQDSADAWNVIGMVALAHNDGARAATAFQQVITIDPNFPEAKANLEKADALPQEMSK
jgi:Flp pilus assembly protein TadD